MALALGSTFGSLYIGAMAATAMYGITTLQTYFYFLYYPTDGSDVKFLVSAVWLLDTAHIVFVTLAMYHYLVINYANPQGLANVVWSLAGSIGLNVAMAFVVQCFFLKRIHQLCQSRYKWWLSSIIGLVVFAHLCFGLETMVEIVVLKDFSRLRAADYIAATPFAVTAILSDILVALTLCVLLHNTGKPGDNSTRNLVNKLIVFAINRCLLTSVCAAAETFVFIALPNSLYFLAFDFVIGKLYTNSLLATLNSRNALHRQDEENSSGNSGNTSTSLRMATIVSGTDRGHGAVNLVRVGTANDELMASDVESSRSSVYHQALTDVQKN